ncbi:DUF4910 domain-containing protein [Alienimonas sp. DA493]|uniref:DUF4910 domain-containing protein n=1 Tax=Alienimonas sp. DA493 TaxID=3373605 RepID=UPI0037548B63
MRLAEELFGIYRAKTGAGVRRSLARLADRLPTGAGEWAVHEVPTGTPILDWEAPAEWNLRDAWIADPTDPAAGRLVDFRRCNLHVLSGSAPIDRRVPWSELKEHLHTAPDRPADVPFRTCEPGATWGFCVSQEQYDALAARGEREYEVRIDATVAPGALTLAEWFLPPDAPGPATGEPAEVLISTHTCHPALAHDGVSGMAVAAELAGALAARPGRRFGYRLLFAPATVGAIAWLAANRDCSDRVFAGLTLACCGDDGPFTLRRSRRGDAQIDRAAAHVLKHRDEPYELRDFVPFGYDQRQFCSPGFDLPVAGLTRTPNGEYSQYHTSADDLSRLSAAGLGGTVEVCAAICDVLEGNRTYVNLKPYGEPRLGPLGLYAAFGTEPDSAAAQRAVQWALNLGDGRHALLDVAERSGLPFPAVARAAAVLRSHDLLTESPTADGRPRPALPAISCPQ